MKSGKMEPMDELQTLLNQQNQAPWAAHLREQVKQNPQGWADDAFCAVARLTQYPQTFEAVSKTIFEVAQEAGWSELSSCLMVAMTHAAWDLVPIILSVPVEHDLSSDEIDYLVVRDLQRGLWSYPDLLRPQIMLEQRNIKKLGLDIFKHSEDTYYAPLNEEVIAKLVKLPKHHYTGVILGRDFAYAQRLPDCPTDLDAPGALPSLVMMVQSGWLDLDTAKHLLEPREQKTREMIARIENEVLANTSRPASGSPGIRRM
jgi:hypothetical protein